ncbi:MAG TPA: SurA N-terminal domain-containing protein, partial [Nitrososphaera sp.]|nr:SurA N-terminal domain-containing protein [Nitrososphaera sp.]
MRDLYRNSLISVILPVCLVFSVIACRDPDKKTLAVVGGSVITGREVETALGRPLSQLHQQIYTLQQQKLNELIDERLLSEEAKRRGVSVESLTEREMNA